MAEVQRVFQLVQWRTEEEARAGRKLSAVELFQAFSSNLTVTHGERITESYAKLALSIHDTMLVHPTIRSLLLLAEEWFGKKSPVDSLYKLEAVQQQAKTLPHIEWVLKCVFDAVVNKVLKVGEVSVSTLTGRKSATGKGPLCQIHFMLFSLRILGRESFKHILKAAKDLQNKHDQTWLGALSAPAQELVNELTFEALR